MFTSIGRFGLSLVMIGIVFGEVLVLVVNRMRCPRTPIAALFSKERRPNFGIDLPEWVTTYNKEIFGGFYAGGFVYAAPMWMRSLRLAG